MKTMNRPQLPFLALLTGLLGITGCESTKPTTVHLLDAPAKPSADAEAERMRLMQNISVVYEPTGEIQSISAASVRDAVLGICQTETRKITECNNATLLSCAYDLCEAQEALCMARTYLAMTKPQPSPIKLGSTWTVPLQAASANVGLAGMSKVWAKTAADQFSMTLEAMGGIPRADNGDIYFGMQYCGDVHPEGTPYGRELPIGGTLGAIFASTGFKEAYSTFKAANDQVIQSALDTSDAELSSTSSPALASQRSIANWRLGVAAFAAGGTTDTLPFSDSGAYCTTGKPREQVRAAIAVFRDAGVNPDDLRSTTLSTNDLLNGTTLHSPLGSVRQRIAEFYDKGELLDTTLVPRIEDFFNIDITAFDEARKALVEEIAAFSRTNDTLPLRVLSGGRTSSILRFAATSAPPTRLPAAYYGALARTNGDNALSAEYAAYNAGDSFYQTKRWSDHGTQYIVLPAPARDLNSDIEGFIGMAKKLMMISGNLPATAELPVTNGSPTTIQLRDDATAPIGAMLAADEVLGHIAVQRDIDFTTIDVYGFDATDRIRVVQGERALRCAVQGSVEGATCSLNELIADDLLLTPTNDSSDLPPTHFGFKKSARFKVRTNYYSMERHYLLKPKAGAPTTLHEGDYEALIGATIVMNSPYTIFSIVKGMDERIASAIEPSKTSCVRPRKNCDDAEFDERIPLDDELSDMSDGIESSWKHYLDLAKQAAAKADQLGADYIQSGLDNDTRLETVEIRQQQQAQQADSYLQRLQAICGTQVDTRSLMPLLKDAAGTGLKTTGGGCSTASDCAATSEGHGAWKCVQDHCLVDIPKLLLSFSTKDPSIQRLSDCLSNSTTTPVVSLGDQPLCLWRDQNNPNLICSGAKPGECPYVQPVDKDTRVPQACILRGLSSTQSANQVAMATVPLGIISTGAPPVGDGGNPTDAHLYEAITLSALTPSGWPNWKPQFESSHILDDLRLAPFARRLNWEARAGGFSAITWDSTPIYETGSPTAGIKAAKWPCSSTGAPYTPGARPLDCTDPAQRYSANMTMLRAVLLAKGFVGDAVSPNGGLRYPEAVLTAVPGDDVQKDWCTAPAAAKDEQIFYLDQSGFRHTSYNDGATFGLQGTRAVRNFLPWAPFDRAECFNQAHLWIEGVGSRTYGTAREAMFKYLNGGDSNLDSIIAVAKWDKELHLLPNTNSNTNPAILFPPFASPSPEYLNMLALLAASMTNTSDYGRELPLSTLDYLNAIGIIAERAKSPPAVDLSAPPVVNTIEDLNNVSAYLVTLGDTIRQVAARSIFANMPEKVLDALRSNSSVGAYPQFGGEMAEQLSITRGALLKIRENGPLLANEVQQMGYDLKEVKGLLQKANIKGEISKLQFMSEMTNQLTACATAQLGASSMDPVSTTGHALAAWVTCGNAFAQINIAQGIANLAATDAKLDGDIAIAQFGSRFASHATSMQTLSLHLGEGQEDLDSALAKIESLRNEAGSQLVDAIYASSEQAAHQAEITSVIGNLFEGKQMRYQAALSNARRMSFLAKRAIEQRLGVELADMKDDLPLVEAPQKWEATACTFTGVNYAALKTPDSNGPNSGPQSFANGFIGDYVTKLENVVESYRLENNFHEGTDTAVISLRDDLFNVRAECPVKGANLLYDAGQLSRTSNPGWGREGCLTEVVEGATVAKANCVTPTPRTDGPTFADPVTSAVPSFDLAFGSGSTDNSAVVQKVDVQPGAYRFTYYTLAETPSAGQVWSDDSGLFSIVTYPTGPTPRLGWHRYSIVFRVNKAGQVKVGFKKVAGAPTGTAAAPMLERLTTLDVTEQPALLPFVNTGTNLEQIQPACPDTDGAVFRSTRWERNCLKLCADGFGDKCQGDRAKTYCYWQSDFNINQRDIQQGRVLNFGGFARGNYNYRIDSLALNFVGNPRDCGSSAAPESCAGAGYLPYSIAHVGPFVVRNHLGADMPAKVFDGNIEHARGLATERYITNPISSSDSSLIEQYMRREFQGRPLDGNFVIRIWDEDGVDFNSIKDVQLVLHYRYWTKFN